MYACVSYMCLILARSKCIKSFENEVADGCEPTMWMLKIKPDSSARACVLIAAKPFLQPQCHFNLHFPYG